jgi:ubiquinone/menaquinone biosynthesis C-methylase UbiE
MPERKTGSIPFAVGGDTATPKNLARRLALMNRYIDPGDRVLDVGCGRGEYLRALLNTTPNAVGIETAADKLRDCLLSHPELRDKVFPVSAESMPFPAGYFDVVIINEVLEHIPDQDAALREIHRVLKPGGRFVLFCPNRIFPFETHGLMVRGKMRMWLPALHYLPASIARSLRIESVARNYWPLEVVKLLRQHGFQVREQAFVQQTFENISGSQPAVIKAVRPVLSKAVSICGKLPILQAFVSVSSFVVATVEDSSKRRMAA